MNLRRLQTFVTVAEQQTVSRAAAVLRISQPALSRQLHELQGEYQVQLFERIGRNLVLTGAGEQLLRDCQALLSHASSVRERMESFASGGKGVLRVAASPQMIEHVFPPLLRSFAARHPHVQLRPIEAVLGDQIAMLEGGQVHLAVNAEEAADDRFGRYTLPPLEVRAAWSRSVDLPTQHTLDIGSVVKQPLLLLNTGFVTRRLFDAACRLGRLQPDIFFESGAPHTLLAIAKGGHGIAIIPSTVRIERGELQVAAVAYQRRKLATPLAILWDKRRQLPRYAESFFEMLNRRLRKELR
jgi:DNA-binding transcriptional LysR family regulator